MAADKHVTMVSFSISEKGKKLGDPVYLLHVKNDKQSCCNNVKN